MQMDGYDVNIGDSVHDLIFGAGKVERLVKEQDRFWVKFGPNNLRCFSNQGFGNFQERTLFWKNPITIIPHKHDEAWDMTVAISNSVAKHLGRKS